MKKIAYLLLFVLTAFVSCKKDNKGPSLQTVIVQLVYPAESDFEPNEGVEVKLTGKIGSFDAKTDATGKATFNVPVDLYDVSASDKRQDASNTLVSYSFNASKTGISVTNSWSSENVISLELKQAQISQIVIKELFVGGTPKDDGSGVFLYDRYVILYNNSNTTANLNNMCFATIGPYNSQSSSPYLEDGVLAYEREGWIPAAQAIWYFQQNIQVEPGQQIVVAISNAINNTLTHSKSINFDNSDYYATYDIEKLDFPAAYPSPAASIPTSHYLKAATFGAGKAWTLSNTSPGLFIFETKGTTPEAFVADASLTSETRTFVSKKVPVSWIVDGVESYLLNNSNNGKRFTSVIDAGFVYHINKEGYSLYRNVDEEATKAIASNADKLVYNYNYGTVAIGGSTDPSGIDAEASIKNGARIIYKDTNNSTNDFHLRSQASLRN